MRDDEKHDGPDRYESGHGPGAPQPGDSTDALYHPGSPSPSRDEPLDLGLGPRGDEPENRRPATPADDLDYDFAADDFGSGDFGSGDFGSAGFPPDNSGAADFVAADFQPRTAPPAAAPSSALPPSAPPPPAAGPGYDDRFPTAPPQQPWQPDQTWQQAQPAAPGSLTPVPDLSPKAKPKRRGPRVAAAVVAGLVVLGGAGYGVFVLTGTGSSSAGHAVALPTPLATTQAPAPTHAPAPAAAPPPAAPVAWCAPSTAGGVVTGNGPGGTDSGPNAILMFETGYYVKRSAAAALQAVAPSAAVPPEANIQQGIDNMPVGTTYCVTIRPQGPGTYSVSIDERRPGIPEKVWPQIITTIDQNGKTLITSIRKPKPN